MKGTLRINVDLSIISINNVRHTLYRRITTFEKVILDCANIIGPITIYEVLLISGLKMTMKSYIEDLLYKLFMDGYLEINPNFDIEIFEHNLDKILKDIFLPENSKIDSEEEQLRSRYKISWSNTYL